VTRVNRYHADLLKEGIIQMGLAVTSDAQRLLLDYLALLGKWNKTYSLTAIQDPGQMVIRHLLDSLSLIPYIKGSRMVDVGCGAGLPGIPLALALPDMAVVLLDSQLKKVRFVTQVITELRIGNIAVAHTRVEDYHPQQMFDTVISRAFASLIDYTGATEHLCRKNGCMLTMKGKYPQKELEALQASGRDAEVLAVQIPGLEAQRHIVCMSCNKTRR
jgi:16S rRNA (guanine527-N7)-methyltransferase